MRYAIFSGVILVSVAALGLVGASGQTTATKKPTATTGTAKAAAAKGKWTPPRLPDGHPDFSGYWSNSTVTPLERPATESSKDTVSPEEAQKLETAGNRSDSARDKRGQGGAAGPGGVGDYNALWYEQGKKVLANGRTSIIIDPPDGRIPALTPQAAARFEADRKYFAVHSTDNPAGQDTITRCITWISSGPPMLPTFYNNNYQIVQTKDSLAIVSEMIHDARIIHIENAPHVDSKVRQWMGDSRAHWEGDTLVVETTNFNGKRNFLGGHIEEGPVEAERSPGRGGRGNGGNVGGRSGAGRPDEHMKVIERFTRTAQDILLYQFTIDDPETYVRPWSGEIPMRITDGPLYEYACHEGNYALMDILSGARAEEKAAPQKTR